MKQAIARIFGNLKAGLATGAIIGTAIMLPVATSAADAVKLEGAIGVANVTNGDNDYVESVNAKYDDVVKVEVYYHNQENPDSNKTANNVRMKINMPTQAGKAQKVSTTVKGDNTTEFKGEATVNLDRDDATLQYIPGSAVWKHNTGSREAPKYEEAKISDDVVLGAQGALMETQQKPCYEYAATVTVLARIMVPGVKVVKESQLKGETNKWSANNTAKPGDTMRYMISYQNTGNTDQKKVVVRDQLPPKMKLVPGSTKLYNQNNPQGKVTSDNVVEGGLEIGTYGPGANAYVIFEATMPAADQLACGDNQFRNVGAVRPENMSEYYNTAVTTVKRDCGAGGAKASYSCDLLTVTKGEGRKITAKVDYTVKDGAKLKSVTYDFGDKSQPLTTDKTTVDYTYAAEGNYNVTAKLLVSANGKDETVVSETCAKPVSFGTVASANTNLPNTGAGSVIGMFLGASAIGFIGHRLFLSRRLAR